MNMFNMMLIIVLRTFHHICLYDWKQSVTNQTNLQKFTFHCVGVHCVARSYIVLIVHTRCVSLDIFYYVNAVAMPSLLAVYP